MKKIVLFSLFISLSINVQAVVVNSVSTGYGVFAVAGTFDAISGLTEIDTTGTEFDVTANASEDTYGTASASAVYDNAASFLPTLAVNAASALGNAALATAFGVQAYHYDGADSAITIDYNLHGSVGDAVVGASTNNLSASVFVIISNALEWNGSIEDLDLSSIASGMIFTDVLTIDNGLNQNSSGSLTFDLATDDNFYVVASMSAISSNGFASALNTFSMNFQNDSNLVAVAADIPAPMTILLFSLGLGLIRLKK